MSARLEQNFEQSEEPAATWSQFENKFCCVSGYECSFCLYLWRFVLLDCRTCPFTWRKSTSNFTTAMRTKTEVLLFIACPEFYFAFLFLSFRLLLLCFDNWHVTRPVETSCLTATCAKLIHWPFFSICQWSRNHPTRWLKPGGENSK